MYNAARDKMAGLKKKSGLKVAAWQALKPNQNACLSMVFSGGVYMAPIIVPIDPTSPTPRTTHGLADIILSAAPERNRERAPRAVRTSPPPVYVKDSCR